MQQLKKPSLAPVVIVISVSGHSLRPQKGEYALEMASRKRGRPFGGAYWLQSRRSTALLAASMRNCGGL